MTSDLSAKGVSLGDDPGPLGGRGGEGGQEGQESNGEHGWAGLGWRVEMEESSRLILGPGLYQGLEKYNFPSLLPLYQQGWKTVTSIIGI